MALITSYVAIPTQISFHHSLIPLGSICIENVIQPGPGNVVVEERAGISRLWYTTTRD